MRERLCKFTVCLWLVLVVCCGCLGPVKRLFKAQDKVDKTEKAIADNKSEQKDIGRDFTYAANLALKADPAPSKFAKVAEDMTERALLASGLPPADEAAYYRQMVLDLISTNAEIVLRGEKELAAKDAELAKVQSNAEKLDQQLSTAEEKLKKVSADNATLAAKWVRLVHLFEIVVGGIVFLLLCSLAVHVLPLIFPELSGAQMALRGAVSAVQHVRDTLSTSAPEAAKTIDSALSVAMPPGSKAAAVINQTKTALGL